MSIDYENQSEMSSEWTERHTIMYENQEKRFMMTEC